MNRRDFLRSSSAAALALATRNTRAAETPQPNILWITCEDISPNLGCYGDPWAITPELDALAARGTRYDAAYAPAPVCSPARSCIITGVHAISQGTQHLRHIMPKSDKIRCYPEYLREAGYYCTNNSKEDYQFVTPKAAWDESSPKAHWRNRKPGQPFFAIFNLVMTHQSRTRYVGEELSAANAALPEALRHNPKNALVPPYYPDTPLVRENLAAYYTQITVMDREAGRLLRELDAEGEAEDTIVFFYSDHGGGIPRGKRWLHPTGIRVPFIVYFPKKFEHLAPTPPGGATDRLISFVDLAPTLFSLTGLPVPGYCQGSAFLGAKAGAPREYIFAARDRVDEGIQCNRTVYDGRFQYIRNFYPHRPRMPLTWYSEVTPIRQEIRRLAAAGQLEGDAAWLAAPSIPAEELYDVKADPLGMRDLARDVAHAERLKSMRGLLRGRLSELLDTGMLTESEILRRCGDTSPYDVFREPGRVPFDRILDTAMRVGMGAEHRGHLIACLGDADCGVRYWAATGLAVLAEDAVPARNALVKACADECPSVRIAAGEALYRQGDAQGAETLADAACHEDFYVQIEALHALGILANEQTAVAPALRAAMERALTGVPKEVPERYADWARSHLQDALSRQ